MKIEFIPSDLETELTVQLPSPSSNNIPNWYKNIPRFKNNDGPLFNNGVLYNNTVKGCVPFYDAMSSGYIQQTWCDIYIDFDKYNNVNFHFSRYPQIIDIRDEVSIPIPNDFHQIEFVWKMQWIPKLPKGWSILITQPFNRMDIQTFTMSAIIDSDVFYHTLSGSIPFYIKKNFKGMIPAGTPMYQIIPIKRENWKSQMLKFSAEKNIKNLNKKNSKFISSYKNLFHQKKSFK